MKRWNKLGAVLSLLTLTLTTGMFAPEASGADCRTYSNSSANFIWDYGWACSFTGGNCTECVSGSPGGGYTSCVYDDDDGVPYCVDHRDW
jgi:hypothetical protein